jgi:hypothetical protein
MFRLLSFRLVHVGSLVVRHGGFLGALETVVMTGCGCEDAGAAVASAEAVSAVCVGWTRKALTITACCAGEREWQGKLVKVRSVWGCGRGGKGKKVEVTEAVALGVQREKWLGWAWTSRERRERSPARLWFGGVLAASDRAQRGRAMDAHVGSGVPAEPKPSILLVITLLINSQRLAGRLCLHTIFLSTCPSPASALRPFVLSFPFTVGRSTPALHLST